MFTPKSLLTWNDRELLQALIHRVFRRRRALERVRGDGAEEDAVRLALAGERVSVGDEEAGEICTTPAGAVTEVRIGSDTEEMMPPMIAGTFLRSTSWVAWSTATEPWLCESRRSVTSWQPRRRPPR